MQETTVKTLKEITTGNHSKTQQATMKSAAELGITEEEYATLRPCDIELLSVFRELTKMEQAMMLEVALFYAWAERNGINHQELHPETMQAIKDAARAKNPAQLTSWIDRRKAELKP